MKKGIIFLILAVSAVMITACGIRITNNPSKSSSEVVADGEEVNSEAEDIEEAEEYPKIVYINNESYYGTDNICEAVPRRMPDGVIETYIESEIMPDSFNSANFGSEDKPLEYMFLDDGQLIVHIEEDWFYFDKQ